LKNSFMVGDRSKDILAGGRSRVPNDPEIRREYYRVEESERVISLQRRFTGADDHLASNLSLQNQSTLKQGSPKGGVAAYKSF
jgi:hypothetical protein